MEGLLLIIMKAFYTNNSNYTPPFLKCDKADNVAFIEFIMLTGTLSFHFSISYTYGLSEHLLTDNNVIILHLWCKYTTRHNVFLYQCLSIDMFDLGRKYVSLVVQLKWHHHIEIKSPPSHPVAFVAINLIQRFRHLFSAWQVDM